MGQGALGLIALPKTSGRYYLLSEFIQGFKSYPTIGSQIVLNTSSKKSSNYNTKRVCDISLHKPKSACNAREPVAIA